MQNSGKALQAALKLILVTLVGVIVICAFGLLARYLGHFIAVISYALIGLWVLFAAFTFYFFRDPLPQVPPELHVIVAPAHGKVDVIDETEEPEFLRARCKRVSIFLSVFDVHVQNAPVAGKVAFLTHTPGKFLNAMRTESAAHNENVLIGIESAEKPGEKIGVRLIAGLIARRIIPWVTPGSSVTRGERISLIQFGSRCDVYLPMSARVTVKPGDHAKGGETVIATRG